MVEYGHYKLLRQDRNYDIDRRTKKGGGLCVYMKKDIEVQCTSDVNINCSDETLEMLHFKLVPRKPKEN